MASQQALLDEEQADRNARDAQGLQPKTSETKTEAESRRFYFAFYGRILLYGQILAWGSYLLISALSPYLKDMYYKKFAFLYEYQLGYVYLIWAILYLTRMYLTLNANGARAEARVDRPDQHVYKVMATSGELASPSAPYVLMANTGPAGRFNRAQRAAYHMDETLPVYLTGSLLAAMIFPHPVVVLALLTMFARINYSENYKESTKARMSMVTLIFLCEHFVGGLNILIAIEALAWPKLAL